MKSYKVLCRIDERSPAVCGHRGAPDFARENTLASFAVAKEHGATWLEFDVRPESGRKLVVHHDPITSEGYDIGTTPLSDLPSYIPLLADIVEQFGDLTLDVELKTDGTGLDATAYAALAAAEITELAALHPTVDMVVTSFDADVLSLFASTCPDIETGFLYYVDGKARRPDDIAAANSNALETALHAGHGAVVPHHSLVTPEMVVAAHAAELNVVTWTVNTPEDIRRCAQAGVDVIIGDNPALILKTLDSLA